MSKKLQLRLGAACLLLIPAQAYASCGSASCTLNTQWEQGATQQPGLVLDMRYEYINQNQLRDGAKTTATGAGDALEQHTVNRSLIGTLEYIFDENWSVALSAPLVNREHTHIVYDTAAIESWNYSRLGDVRMVGRYQPSPQPFQHLNYGFKFGAKLPTGATDVTNAENTRAERSLQPGTGSTDIVLGAYLHQALLTVPGAWFTQATWQHAVKSFDRFTPGDQVAVDVGMSYRLTEKWGTVLQLNALHKARDSGANAEQDLSGGLSVFLSPGLSYTLGPSSQIYGFVQKPLYQYVNGVQLTAEMTAVVGLRHHF